MDQTGDAARLAREARIWRAATCCLAVLAVPAGIALGQGGAAVPAAAKPIAVLEVPPDPKLQIVGNRIELDIATKKRVVSGGVTLIWSNGVRLTVPTARVSLNTGGEKPAPQRVTIEP